ncbi:MAG: DUF3786 domain-containing protein [Chloroflexi bacterium]|nr:DUF3786 domain-containing protein [Chloroflexota bacterium]
MQSKRLPLPEQKNYDRAYELAYRLAVEQLARIDDIEQQCRQSGSQYQVIDSQKTILIQYLNQSYLITFPDTEISLVNSAEKVATRDKVLILHYFTSAKGTPIANRLITFRELPEGSAYFPTFSKRTIQPLLEHFGKEPHRLIEAGGKLGGHKTDYGDAAVTINAFSRVPITIILWRGDDEFVPQGNIVFDATISDYLPTEDITVLCGTIAWRLINYLR